MELLVMGLAVSFLVSIAERRERRAMFAPAPCMHCKQWVHWDQRNLRWLHDDGRQRAEWPNIRYDLPGPKPPLHPAVPKALWWPQER